MRARFVKLSTPVLYGQVVRSSLPDVRRYHVSNQTRFLTRYVREVGRRTLRCGSSRSSAGSAASSSCDTVAVNDHKDAGMCSSQNRSSAAGSACAEHSHSANQRAQGARALLEAALTLPADGAVQQGALHASQLRAMARTEQPAVGSGIGDVKKRGRACWDPCARCTAGEPSCLQDKQHSGACRPQPSLVPAATRRKFCALSAMMHP